MCSLPVAERRRLERDLHDGAQQQLLALSYDLRVALANGQAERAGDAIVLINHAIADVEAAIGELRTLAGGIYPAVLAEAGLAVALTSFSDTAPIAVELAAIPSDRFDAAVEAAAYATVAGAVANASRRGGTVAIVSITHGDAALHLAVTDDGGASRPAFEHLADRVGALGGSLSAGHQTVTAVIPCG